MSRLKVLFNFDTYPLCGGTFQYTHSLLKALLKLAENEIELTIVPKSFCLEFLPKNLPANIKVVPIPGEIYASVEELNAQLKGPDSLEIRGAGFNPRLKEFFSQFDFDLFFMSSPGFVGFEAGIPYLMPIFDLQHRLQPHFHEVSCRGIWLSREFMYLNSIKHASGIIVDAVAGKDDVLNFYGERITADQLFAIPLPPAYTEQSGETLCKMAGEVRKKYHLHEKYFFYPAQFWTHKNHARLIHAVQILEQQHGLSVGIALCGSRSANAAEARDLVYDNALYLAEQLGVAHLIRYLGYVPDEDMVGLYAGAIGLVMPTFFGPTNTPVPEAWANHCPVITSNLRGIDEQVGDAGLLVDPNSVEEIANAMKRLHDDESLRQDLIQKGLIRLKSSSLDSFAKNLNITMRKVAEMAKRT